jgi:hypothetical protein
MTVRSGLVLVRLGTFPPKKIIEEIRSLKGVIDAYAVFGRFDIVVFMEAEDYYELKDVSDNVAGVNGVKSSETLVHGD